MFRFQNILFATLFFSVNAFAQVKVLHESDFVLSSFILDSGKIYFSEGLSIRQIDQHGGSFKEIMTGEAISYSDMVSDGNFIYWVDSKDDSNNNSVTRIMRTALDGSVTEVFQDDDKKFTDYARQLRFNGHEILWIANQNSNRGLSKIVAKAPTASATRVVKDNIFKIQWGAAVDGSILYFADQSALRQMQIKAININTGDTNIIARPSGYGIIDMALSKDHIFWMTRHWREHDDFSPALPHSLNIVDKIGRETPRTIQEFSDGYSDSLTFADGFLYWSMHGSLKIKRFNTINNQIEEFISMEDYKCSSDKIVATSDALYRGCYPSIGDNEKATILKIEIH